MFFFIFYFVLGTVIYFVHMSVTVCNLANKYISKMELQEAQRERLALEYLDRILFQTIIMILFPITYGAYSYISVNYSNYILISSGLFTLLWLIITGTIIKAVYYLFTNKISAFRKLNFNTYKVDKEVLWTMCPILYGVILSMYDDKALYIILAVVLGKFIWMDIKIVFPNKNQIKNFWSKYKVDCSLLLYQITIMVYIMLRLYPLRDGVVGAKYTVDTFLLLALTLMPILDLCLYHRMVESSNMIKNKK